MLLDLHNHTIESYDGCTSESQLIDACLMRGINAIAVTEHDKSCTLSYRRFEENGIELISGCEYTTNLGAHIIGLFVSGTLPSGCSRHEIIEHIKMQNGLVVMPHPWKKDSGYMAVHDSDELIFEFDFIEAINGGWNSTASMSKIKSVSQSFGLIMIASSDSHKGCQVGLCATKIDIHGKFVPGMTEKVLRNAHQEDLQLLIDDRAISLKGRKVNKLQVSAIYQIALGLVPMKLRRLIKIVGYTLSDSHKSKPADFIYVSVVDL
jgi:predicted metal-dependent phosphoesterase TrpH